MTTELATVSTANMALMLDKERWDVMRQQADIALKSGLLPTSIKTPEQVLAIALQGAEVGFGLMASLRHISIINGRPTMSAEGMLALGRMHAAGFKSEPVQDTAEVQSVALWRPGMSKPYISSFSLEDAKRAGLGAKEMYGKYPKAMLWARAVSAGMRKIAPDALMGISYTPADFDVEVNEEGMVIEAEVSEAEPPQTMHEALQQKRDQTMTRTNMAQPEETEAPGHKQLRELLKVGATAVGIAGGREWIDLVRKTLDIQRPAPIPTPQDMTMEELQAMNLAVNRIADERAQVESEITEEAVA